MVNSVDSLDEATVTLGLLAAVGSCTTNYEASKSCVFAVYRSHSDALLWVPSRIANGPKLTCRAKLAMTKVA